MVTLHLLILFVGSLAYLEPKLFLLIEFYNGTVLVIKIIILLKKNVYNFFLSE